MIIYALVQKEKYEADVYCGYFKSRSDAEALLQELNDKYSYTEIIWFEIYEIYVE